MFELENFKHSADDQYIIDVILGDTHITNYQHISNTKEDAINYVTNMKEIFDIGYNAGQVDGFKKAFDSF